MKADPRLRKNGLCAVCGKKRRTAPAKSLLPNLAAELAKDPFCSTSCARAYHGQQLDHTLGRPSVRPSGSDRLAEQMWRKRERRTA